MATPNPKDGLVVTLTREQLEELLDERVRRVVREEIATLVEPRFLDTADVAAMLKVCTSTIRNLMKGEGLPVARYIGREPRFERDAVVKWMLDRGQKGTPSDRPPARRKHLERVK